MITDSRRRKSICLAAFLLTIVFLMNISAGIVTTAHADELVTTVTGELSPSGELTLGSAYSVSGVITSETVLSRVFGGVYTVSGDKVVYDEYEPNDTYFDIGSTFDNIIPFNVLPAGDYVYKIEAEDTAGSSSVVINSSFSIVDNSPIASEISVSEASVPPDALPTNAVFSVRGLVSSAFVITDIRGGVYESDDTPTAVYYEDEPNTTAYDLNATFDNYLDFSLLDAGEYTYRITATDLRGYKETLIEKKFSVVADDTAPSDIRIYDTAYPTGTLMKGRGVPIRGVIRSTFTLDSITAGIFKAKGSSCDYNNEFAFTVDGGRLSYDLRIIDDDIVFDAIPVGEYVFRVEATDIKGCTKELVSSPFRIRSTEQSDEKQQAVLRGIDVNENNGDIDWAKVYADNVDFAILRAGRTYNSEASFYSDTAFSANYDGAKAAGLKVGVYFKTSAVTKAEMKADIDALAELLNGKEIDMPVYIDVESSRQTSLGKKSFTDLLAYGCGLLNDKGFKAGVFSSYTWFVNYIDAETLKNSGYEIWLAFYPDIPDNYNFSDFCVTWQYCSDGSVDGITGDVNKDYRYAVISLETNDIALEQPMFGTMHCDKESASSGERVTVSFELDRLHKVTSVKYNGKEASKNSDGTYSFSMPDSAVTVTAEISECDPSETAADFGEITDMPVPFGTAVDTVAYHSKPCGERLAMIPEALMKLAYGGYDWEYDYADGKPKYALTLMDYANVYSFIQDNTLDHAKVRDVLSNADLMVHRRAFTDEEIDLLLGNDEAAVMAHFASPYTIVIGRKGYSAKWMYDHTTDEWAKEGITPEMVKAVLPNYYDALYVQAAADAFSQKLFKYTSVLCPTKWKQWKKGDVNLDGTLNEADAELLQSYLDYKTRLTFSQWASADIDENSAVDEQDLDKLKAAIAAGDKDSPEQLGVIEFCQYPDYPTGCESVSLYMLLNFYGVDVTVDDIYDLLPMGAQPYDDENGIRHGANPEREFVGNPRSYSSYGVFNDPIAAVAESFKSGVNTKRNASIEDIKSILDNGDPVLAWYVSYPMRDIYYRWSWIDENGETVDWPAGEHAVVICGYDDNSLTYRDPNAGTTVIIDYDTFLKSFNELGGRIVYYMSEKTDTETDSEATPDTATDSEAESDTSTDSETASDTSTDSETASDTSTDSETASDTSTDSETASDSDTDTPDIPETSDTPDIPDTDSDSDDSDTDTPDIPETSDTPDSPETPDNAKTPDTPLLGDADLDGQITSSDALLILRMSVGLESCTDDQLKIVDVDGDGQITANDALEVLRYSAGMADENSPINKPIAA